MKEDVHQVGISQLTFPCARWIGARLDFSVNPCLAADMIEFPALPAGLNLGRHQLGSANYRLLRERSFKEWSAATAA